MSHHSEEPGFKLWPPMRLNHKVVQKNVEEAAKGRGVQDIRCQNLECPLYFVRTDKKLR